MKSPKFFIEISKFWKKISIFQIRIPKYQISISKRKFIVQLSNSCPHKTNFFLKFKPHK